MIKKIVFSFLIISFFLLNTQTLYADEKEDLKNQEIEIDKKLVELGNAKNTFANQIKLLDSQYQLTLLKINQTEYSIKTLENEISKLTVEIGKLEIQINELSEIYINQTIQNYKLQKRIPQFAFLFSSTLNNFLEQHRYVSSLQTNSQNNLINMETIRANYDKQKTSKEKKQNELELLKKTLAGQKISLNNQKTIKNNLLISTKNDEVEWKKKLAAVQSKLSSFANTNASCLANSPSSEGYYFSQIDPVWCNQKPAGTEGCIVSGTNKSCTIGNIGCYITSTAMVLRKLGVDTNPSKYAEDISHMESSADMKAIATPAGYNYCRISTSDRSIESIYKIIDNELSKNRFVIVQVPLSPYHFVVLISGTNGVYRMHDPWRGRDLGFNGYYNKIISVRLVTPEGCP